MSHYSIQKIDNIQILKDIFPEGPNSLNLLFTGTSGVHGTYTKPWQLLSEDEDYKELWNKDGTTYITVMVFQPRLVCLQYGELKVNREELEWLWDMSNKSSEIIKEDHFKQKS